MSKRLTLKDKRKEYCAVEHCKHKAFRLFPFGAYRVSRNTCIAELHIPLCYSCAGNALDILLRNHSPRMTDWHQIAQLLCRMQCLETEKRAAGLGGLRND